MKGALPCSVPGQTVTTRALSGGTPQTGANPCADLRPECHPCVLTVAHFPTSCLEDEKEKSQNCPIAQR